MIKRKRLDPKAKEKTLSYTEKSNVDNPHRKRGGGKTD
jgi:hypothetical protein